MSKQAKLLYIEDDELERRAFLRLVREKGLPWQIKHAETLAAARAHLAGSCFDAIVADNHLPDGESTELFDEIKDTPFVLVTGTLEEQLALRTLERGADDYLVKDLGHRHLEALPFAVEKTLYRKAIHERERQLTRELRESEQRLRATFDNAASGIIETDDQDRLVAANDRLCQMLGYAREQLLGRSVQELTYPEDRPRSEQLNARLRTGEIPMLQYEKRYLKRDASPLWVQLAISAVRDEAGRYLYSVGTVVDISARKAAEAQVRLQAAALEAAPNAISLSKTDRAGTIIWVNPAFTTLTGYSAEEAIGHSHHLLSSGRQGEAFYRQLWQTVERGELWRGELVNRRKDGTLYHEEMGITPLRDEQGKITHYVAVKQDITARKLAEQALHDQARLLDLTHDAIIERDLQDRITFWNRGAELRYGWSSSEVRGEVTHRLLGTVFPVPMEEILRQLHREGSWEGELVHSTRAGQQIVVASRWVLVRADDLRPAAILEINNDITERKAAEAHVRQLNQELTQRNAELASQRDAAEQAKQSAEQATKAKDHFLAVLSHELRSPLTPVLPALSALETLVPEEGAEYLEIARRNVELEARLIDDMLDVTRIVRGKVELQRTVVELCTILRRAAEVCQPDIEARRLHFEVHVEGGPHPVYADAARLQQVFWNLIKNAVKFTPHGGCVGVRCEREDGYAVVRVTDSGEGIEPEALDRIFNAFEQEARSTTRQFGGLGLGLAISKALVEMHGGSIHAHSAGKGQGATFAVRLPIHQAQLAEGGQPQAVAPAEPQQATRSLKILLVEDHGDTARVLSRVLSAHGHTVERAGDVATALDLARKETFDVLLSDLGLPDGSGYDLMRQLLLSSRCLPAIAISGYGMASDVQQSREAGFTEHLTKPVSMDSLLAAVNRVASTPPTPPTPPAPPARARA
jgi:two-component system, chemotaxis family, CheB/CheR fusion protein